MSELEIIGLGASTIDILSLVDHLPAEDENMRAPEISIQGGGPVATAMVTAARLGARTAMIDVIDEDWRGAIIRAEFERDGVDTRYLKTGPGESPASCILVKKDNGARSIVWAPGTVPEVQAEELPLAAIRSAKILHVNGRHWRAGMEAVRVAREAGVKVSFDGGAGRYRAELDELVPLTDICIVARDFAEKYTRESDMEMAALKLLTAGPALVVVTEGVRGSQVYTREAGSVHQPAFLLPHVVDTTGCGDSYHGAFLFGLVKGMHLEETASLASAVAAMNTQRLGGRQGLPTYEQVQAFVAAQAASR